MSADEIQFTQIQSDWPFITLRCAKKDSAALAQFVFNHRWDGKRVIAVEVYRTDPQWAMITLRLDDHAVLASSDTIE